ncbi:MAG: hypothetical protein JXA96_17065 [Sedimentisphaerales bacterium]|nr:hypothetical protein [Sedimentisphaerales bacterium]
MVKKIKYSKLAIVIFLTVLIWFWADRALEEEYPIRTATIVVGRTKPELWVSFPESAIIDINEIKLSGPASVIDELKQTINNEPEKLKFILYPEQFGIDKAGEYSINVREIIESSWIKKSGLLIKECDPSKIQVKAVNLVKKNIEVQCYDKNLLPISLETPQSVSMFVPADRRLFASVILSDEERAMAIQQPIRKKPTITLSKDEIREAESFVEIKLPPQENILKPYSINNATFGYVVSDNLLNGQYIYKVTEESLREIVNIQILATPNAKDAYEAQDYQVTLKILDGDIEKTRINKSVRREVSYLLPEEFVRADEIKLTNSKVEAIFTVTPVETNENSQ